MAAPELTHPTIGYRRPPAPVTPRPRPRSELVHVLAAVWLLTIVAGLLGLLVPALAPGGGPHPVLHGSTRDMLWILVTNLRLLSVPFAFVLIGFHRSRSGRAFGDLLGGALVTLNCLRVGLALGRYGTRLVPYIPQLPIEWFALALSASAWIAARNGGQPRSLRAQGLQTLVAAVTAAAIETWLTPHAQ